jgi:predicted transcriptional regulator
VLSELIQSPQPLHINELARRVGVEASPVRMHLELLVKAGLAVEVESLGRERKFATSLRNVRLILIGAQRMRRAGWVAGSGPAADGEAERPKEVRKLEKKIASLEEDRGKIEARIRESFRELEEVWEHESRARGRNKS